MLDSVLGAIGATPLVALNRLAAGLPARVAVKLEYYSPGGSVKDRVALRIIEDAERAGRLRPGGTVVELTSGNMGIGLAIVCALRSYRMIAVMSEGNSVERRRILEALGADVVLVPQVGTPRPGQVSAEDLEQVEIRTQELVRELGAFRADQFRNPSSVAAHESATDPVATAPGSDTVPCPTYFASGKIGSISTGTSFSRSSAPFIAGGPISNTSHKIQGTGYAMMPPLWDPSLCDGFLTAGDDEAAETGRRLARVEGIFGGFSAGANVACALRLARQAELGALVVTVACDTGLKYLSTDLFG